MKLTVLGGGGVRSPFLAKSLTNKAKELGVKKIVFMDNDEEKLEIYGDRSILFSNFFLCHFIDFW